MSPLSNSTPFASSRSLASDSEDNPTFIIPTKIQLNAFTKLSESKVSSHTDKPLSSKNVANLNDIRNSDVDKNVANLNDIRNSEVDKISEDLYQIPSIYSAAEHIEAIDAFNTRLNKFTANSKKHAELIKKIQDIHESLNGLVSIIHNNHEIFLIFFRIFLSNESYELVKLNLSDKKELIKSIEALIPVELLELYIYKLDVAELERIQEDFKDLLRQDKTLKKVLEDQLKPNSSKLEAVKKKCKIIAAEFFFCKVLPFVLSTNLSFCAPIANNFDKKNIVKPFKLFFKFFKYSLKFVKLYQSNQIRKKWTKNQKANAIDFKFTKLFQKYVNEHNHSFTDLTAIEDLIKLYESETGKRAYKKQKLITERLENEKAEFEKLLNEKIENFNININEPPLPADLSDFKQSLQDRGFFSHEINNITSIEEWQQKIKEKQFVEQICKDSVEHHMTMGKILHSGMNEMLNKKISTEKFFLIFNTIKNTVDLLFNIIQLALIIPKSALYLAQLGLKDIFTVLSDLLEENVPFQGINLMFFFNPDIDISIFGAFSLIITHIVGYAYKPNEFSLQGYIISFLKRWEQIYYTFLYLLLGMLKISFELLNKILSMTLHKSFSDSTLYSKLVSQFSANKEKYSKVIDKLDAEMNELKKLDIQKDLNPFMINGLEEHQILKKYLEENDCPKKIIKKLDAQLKKSSSLDEALNQEIDQFLEENFLYKREKILNNEVILKYTYDKLNVVVESLNKADESLFSENDKNFFNSANISFDDKPIKNQVEKLFTASAGSFFKLLHT